MTDLAASRATLVAGEIGPEAGDSFPNGYSPR